MVIGGGKTRSVIAACAVALFAFSARAEWKYYAAGADGNPTNVACITDGSWILQVSLSSASGTITIGGDYTTKILAGSGVLDLRGLKVTVDGKDYDKINLQKYAFRGSVMTEFYADNITEVGSYAFSNSPGVKNIELGGTFASLGLYTFNENNSVTNLVINSKNFKTFYRIFFYSGALKTLMITTTNAVSYTTVSSDYQKDKVTNLTVNGPAWTQANLDNILANHSGADGSTAEKAAKPCTIYVDKSMGWDGTGDYAQDWSPSALTDYEKAVKPKKCFGVYVTAKSERKAWLVNTANSKGLLLIVR